MTIRNDIREYKSHSFWLDYLRYREEVDNWVTTVAECDWCGDWAPYARDCLQMENGSETVCIRCFYNQLDTHHHGKDEALDRILKPTRVFMVVALFSLSLMWLDAWMMAW